MPTGQTDLSNPSTEISFPGDSRLYHVDKLTKATRVHPMYTQDLKYVHTHTMERKHCATTYFSKSHRKKHKEPTVSLVSLSFKELMLISSLKPPPNMFSAKHFWIS